MRDDRKLALVTVTSEAFAPGTAVTLASFRACNPWFHGDVIVFDQGLSDEARACISMAGEVRSASPPPDLIDAIATLTAAHPGLASRSARFLSIAALSLAGYDRVLFLDSDVVVTGDFAPLLDISAPLLAAPESAMLRGKHRDADSFLPVDAGGNGALAAFNAGMMVIDASLACDAGYREALAQLVPSRWNSVQSGHTDQVALNRAFADRARHVSPRYNLMLGHHASGFAPVPIPASEVCMFHFNGPAKPWNPQRMLGLAATCPIVAYAWSRWNRAAEQCAGDRLLQFPGTAAR